MNIIKQISIFSVIILISQFIDSLFSFKFPTSVLALVILFLLLLTKILKIKDVEEFGNFLQKNMSLFCVPLAVSILDDVIHISDKILPIIIICLISFFISFLTTSFSVMLTKKITTKIKSSINNKKESYNE